MASLAYLPDALWTGAVPPSFGGSLASLDGSPEAQPSPACAATCAGKLISDLRKMAADVPLLGGRRA
jgi:hypothetical protein